MIHMTTSLAVVTGAASGIGLPLPHELVARSIEARRRGSIDGNPTQNFSEMP
jgi:NADP-dependent 3-hydroxy acid dehydrogenase YdfG